MEKDFEIEYRDGQIKDLREALSGTKRETGYFDQLKGKWEINYSSILTRLIQEAGRWCEYYASDLFIYWSSINRDLENGNMNTNTFVFAFRESGIDNKTKYEKCRAKGCEYRNYYRAVWFLEVTVDKGKIEMVLHK